MPKQASAPPVTTSGEFALELLSQQSAPAKCPFIAEPETDFVIGIANECNVVSADEVKS